jgi:hypothetical protein
MKVKNWTQVETLFVKTCHKIDNTGLPTIIQSVAYVFNTNPKKVNNPTTVTRKAKQIFGSAVKIVESTAKGKKYAIIKPDGNSVNFGSIDYQDHTKHCSATRRDNYLKRAKNIKVNWKANKYS